MLKNWEWKASGMEERFEKLWVAKTNYFLIGFSVTQIQLKNAHKNKLRLSIST